MPGKYLGTQVPNRFCGNSEGRYVPCAPFHDSGLFKGWRGRRGAVIGGGLTKLVRESFFFFFFVILLGANGAPSIHETHHWH